MAACLPDTTVDRLVECSGGVYCVPNRPVLDCAFGSRIVLLFHLHDEHLRLTLKFSKVLLVMYEHDVSDE